jgi:uncharacterized membrane protein (UPF0136 family)
LGTPPKPWPGADLKQHGWQGAGFVERNAETLMKKTGHWIIAYGCFLILIGLIGYLSNPEKAKTALISGGTFGSLSIIWGVLSLRQVGWAVMAAFVTSCFLTLIFLWRASVGWLAVAQGDTTKLVAAALITLMLLASLALLVVISKRRFGSVEPNKLPA